MSRAKEILINDIIRQTHFIEAQLGSLSLENLVNLVDHLFILRRETQCFQSSTPTAKRDANDEN